MSWEVAGDGLHEPDEAEPEAETEDQPQARGSDQQQNAYEDGEAPKAHSNRTTSRAALCRTAEPERHSILDRGHSHGW
jgi:hypothetical protein